MSELDLDAIQARADAVTPGPWCVEPWSDDYSSVMAISCETCGITICRTDQPARDDLLFIAAAIDDIPALVAEVRRLRDQLTRAEHDQDLIWAHLKQLISDERLTEDLEDLIKDDSYLHGLMDAHSDKAAGRKWGDPE